MKVRFNLFVSIIVCVFVQLSCKKNDPEIKHFRISKTTYSGEGISQTQRIFVYNNIGSLIKISDDDSYSKTYYSAEIEYNKENQPIKITQLFSLNDRFEATYYIDWMDTGFVITLDNAIKDIYILNSLNQITTIYHTYKYENMQVFDTSSIVHYKRDGHTNMSVVRISCPGFTNVYSDIKYTFSPIPSPYQGINIAVLSALPFYASSGVECQNDFCTSGRSFIDNIGREIKATMTYKVNDLNYPIQATILYNDQIKPNYRTFEYETF